MDTWKDSGFMASKPLPDTPQQLSFQSSAFEALMKEDEFKYDDTGNKKQSRKTKRSEAVDIDPIYEPTTYEAEFKKFVERFGRTPTEKEVRDFAYTEYRIKLREYWRAKGYGSTNYDLCAARIAGTCADTA